MSKLRGIIRVIPTIILIMCIVEAFATHDWDIKATIFPESPMEMVKKFIPLEGITSGELLEIENFEISEDGSKLMVKMTFRSPLNIPLRIEDLSGEVVVVGGVYRVSLPQEVEVLPGEVVDLELEGKFLETGEPFPSPSVTESVFRNLRMKLNIKGLRIEVSM
ncbi:MAG: hypothetical protein ACXQTS_03310 [Candidatus Methanospirareceae archaeon]